MANYINKLGDIYTQEELEAAALENEVDIDTVITDNELTQEDPGKKKGAAAKGSTAAPKKKRTLPTTTKPESSSKDSSSVSSGEPTSEVTSVTQGEPKKGNFLSNFKNDKRKPKQSDNGSPVDFSAASAELTSPKQEDVFSMYTPEYITEQRERESIKAAQKRLEDASIIASLNDSKTRVDQKIEQTKRNEYADELGDLIWSSDEDLQKPEVYQAISLVASPDKSMGQIAPMLNNELQDFEYENINDGKFIINNLPGMQQGWVISNGEAMRNADLSQKINTREKASENGKEFLNFGEKELLKKTSLLNKAKTEKNTAEISRLESEIKTSREALGLKAKLYDENGKLLTAKKALAWKENQDANAAAIAETSGLDELRAAQEDSYYQLLALSDKALQLKDKIWEGESNIEKIGSYFQNITSEDPEENEGYFQDIKNLGQVYETGKLPSNLNELPGNSPIAKAFNQKLQEYVTLTKAIELNADPITAEKNYKIVDFIDETYKAFGNKGLYSATGLQNKKEAASAFNEALISAGFKYENPKQLEKILNEDIGDLSLKGTAHLVPLVGSLFLTKKLSGPQLTQAGNIFTAWSSKVFGNSRAMRNATELFVGGAKEVVLMAGADEVLANTTGAPPVDATFAASLGVGNVLAGKLIKKMVAKKIPFLSPILMFGSQSKTVSQAATVLTGATSGTVVMNIAERATLIKNQLVADGKIDQAEQWAQLSDYQHIAGTFGSLALLGGFAPKLTYENLKSDISKLPMFDVESSNAGKVLGIDGKLKVSKGKEAENRNIEIDLAEQSAIKKIRSDYRKKSYKGEDNPEAMANEEAAIKKAANVLRGNVDIQVAKANIKAGLTNYDATDLWVTANRIKYGEKLDGNSLDILASNPIELIANQLGLKKNSPMYDLMDSYQNTMQGIGDALDQIKIFSNTPERGPMLENMFNQAKVQNEIKANEALAKEHPELKVVYDKKLEELTKKSEALESDARERINKHIETLGADLEADIKAAEANAKAKGKEVIIYEGKDANERFEKVAASFGEVNELKSGEISFGYLDPNGNLHINKSVAKEYGRTGSGSHESAHLFLRDWMKDENGDLTDEGVEFIDSWLATLSPKELKVVTEAVEQSGNYAEGKSKNEYYEEYLAAFAEANRTGELSYNKESINSFKSFFDKTLEKVARKTGEPIPEEASVEEITGILKSLAESGKKGEASEKAISFAERTKGTTEISRTKITRSKEKIEDLENQIEDLTEAWSYGGVTDKVYKEKLKVLEDKIDALENPVAEVKAKPEKATANYENEAREVIKDNKGKVASDKVQAAYEAKGVDAAMEIINLFKPITKALVDKRRDAPGFDRELLTDEIETGEGGILSLIQKYDPAKGVPLAALINTYLPVRAITASRRVLDKEFSKDIDDQKGLMATETAEQSFEKEAPEAPKYKNLLDQKIVDEPVVQSITNKVLTTLRTAKARLDAPVSINRTVTPIISEIRDIMGKQADIDIKTAMGGKKDNQLRSWLLKNKKATLENMTTTWLMGLKGVGGIPQAIQKRINGKWVNYPEWVDQKIDREAVSTDNAGRTSGAELVRRLPNAVNLVSDADYLGQFLEATGNPIRGRKESLAKATAEEISFDIIAKDFAEEGPLFEALVTNQERQGVTIGDAMAVDVIRQIERGNIKRAKAKGETTDISKAKDNFHEFFNNLNIKDKSIVSGYIFNTAAIDKEKAATNPLIQEYMLHQRSMEEAKKLGSEVQKAGSVASVEALDRTLSKLKNADNKTIASSVNEFLKAELKSFKTSNGNFFTTNKEYLTYVLDPALKKAFGNERVGELYKEGVLGLKEKIVSGKLRTYITINGEVFKHNKPISEIKSELKKANTADKGKEVIKTVDAEAAEQQKYVIDTVEYYKKNNMIEEGKNHINLLAVDMLGAIRKMSKMGFWVDGLKSSEGRLEHNTTINDLKNELKRFLEDPNMTRKDLEAFVDKMRVNLVPLPADQALTDSNLKYTGNDRHFAPELLEALIPYRNRMHNIESVYGSKEILDAGMKNAKGAKERRLEANKSEAIQKSILRSKENKGISVLDFDDTLARTKSNVLYTMPDGERGKLNAEEFAKSGQDYLDRGAVFDFSEFSKVNEGKKGPMFDKAMKLAGKFGTKDVYVLTARPADSNIAIQEFLKAQGLNLKLENIVGLGNSAAQAKADWIISKAAEGYNDFYFSDDAIQNVKAVKDALSVLDIKSKVQQAKIKRSKGFSEEFNKIIEENKGVENYKVYSDIVAKRRGAGKNRFDFYVPPSAADFELLLYNFMGKGARGEEQQKFFNEALIKPYINGVNLMDGARQSIKNSYKALTKAFPEVQKKLEKLGPDEDFTYDQAIRVALWNDAGIEIPGLTKRDNRKLVDMVNSDPELLAFKEGLKAMSRQDKGWVEPSENWDTDTIVSDLFNITQSGGRKKFLGEFIENAEAIFGKWDGGRLVGPNMNKVQAVYGTNVREALEDSIYRMTNGKNRSYGNDKETTMWSNWVTGSTGVIMFLNTRSASLQLLSTVNYLNLRDNNPVAAAKAFADQKQYWGDFATIWNSDKMKERRGGLREDVIASEIANAAAGSKNKAKAVVSYLLKIGYTPTQLADSFAISSGGSAYYRNRIKTHLKEGMTKAEAEALAWEEFSKVTDETQQSGDPKDISKQQASGAGRLLLTFQNTAMQQSRLVKKAYLDLKNGRGDAKTNIAKIGYYLVIQNTAFTLLQQGLFSLLFDEDEEEEKRNKNREEKAVDLVNGVLDTVLRGTGFLGGIAATLKNVAVKYTEQQDKKQKDYAAVTIEAANISPPIGSKIRKIYSGLKQTEKDKDLITARGWDVMQDGRVHLGPNYSIAGKGAEVAFNIPMDRLVNKIENVSQALNNQNKAWQRVAVALGFTPWSVGIEKTPGDLKIIEEAKAKREVEGKEKAKETREAKKEAEERAYNSMTEEQKFQYRRKKRLEKKEKAKEKKEKAKEEKLKKRKMG